MIYISLNYYVLVISALIFYYLVPLSKRWMVLLAANVCFYICFYKTGWWILLSTIILSYILGQAISHTTGKIKKIIFIFSIVVSILPWFLIKNTNYLLTSVFQKDPINWVVPLGISFYTLQIIAYLADIFKGTILPQNNPFKYALFISFFPQILQGPIPRYEQLSSQLMEGHTFKEEHFSQGCYYIIWGFFLKLVIADKAAIIVNTIFDHYSTYAGIYIWIASFLYSIQLYTDFLACTVLAKGVSKLFGIDLVDNFHQPYFAVSVKDFWSRWHISLSTWLKDYIYIPLGGNRNGTFRKFFNLFLTFIISGIWHGSGFKFIIWGSLHAFYQIVGQMTFHFRETLYSMSQIGTTLKKFIKQITTFFFINLAWIIFRAPSLDIGLSLIRRMFQVFNPWILFDDQLFTLGLEWKEFIVLILAIIILFVVDYLHERNYHIGIIISNLILPIRWIFYLVSVISILILGTYGFGFNAQDFIYGGF